MPNGLGGRAVGPRDARQDTPWPVRSAGGCRERRAVPCIRRELLHDWHRPRGRWRHEGLVTAVSLTPDVNASAVPAAQRRLHRSGLGAAAFAFLIVMAVATLPSPLYGLYRTAGTAITYLIELRLRADPKASPVRARTIGTSVTVGALGVGPLIAGCLAQWVPQPLTVPYLVFVALGAIALIGFRGAAGAGGAAAGGQ